MSDDPIKDALRMMPYGFYSITSRHDGDSNAMVANWVSQVSFAPRLVAVSLQRTSYSYGLITAGGVFVVNIFKTTDVEAIKPFTKGRNKNPDKMADADFTAGPATGVPVLAGAAAYFECKVVRVVDVGGDHDIIVGEVIGAGVNSPAEVGEVLSLPDLGWSYAG